MKILVTGSAGHLGEGLMRYLPQEGYEALGIDLLKSPFTSRVGSITDRVFVQECLDEVDVVMHTATLHKPHVETHSKQAFVETNITGTLNLLEESVASGVKAFVFTSTTSAFGAALSPPPGEPAAWIEESVRDIPKNIYGATKTAAEGLCELFARKENLPVIVLRTSRFFPEDDDNSEVRNTFDTLNAKANEFLYRRVDLEDVVEAHILAMKRAEDLNFGRYIISATTPFEREDCAALRTDPKSVVAERYPSFESVYERHGFRMFDSLDRVYDNARARAELGWAPKYDFQVVMRQLSAAESGKAIVGSALARAVGKKGYHAEVATGIYPFS